MISFPDFSSILAASHNKQSVLAQLNQAIESLKEKHSRSNADGYLQLALDLALHNILSGRGGPFAALIAHPQLGVLGVGANAVISKKDPSAHAEIEALRYVERSITPRIWQQCVLYTSSECCPMCMGMVLASGIKEIHYVNDRYQAETIGFSDQRQYQLLHQPYHTLMQDIGDNQSRCALLGSSDAVIIDQSGYQIAPSDQEALLPFETPSMAAIRHACKHHNHFWLPSDFRLISKHKLHPSAWAMADWAHITYALKDAKDERESIDVERIGYCDGSFETLDHEGVDAKSISAWLAGEKSTLTCTTSQTTNVDILQTGIELFRRWTAYITQGQALPY